MVGESNRPLWKDFFHLGCWRELGYAPKVCSNSVYSIMLGERPIFSSESPLLHPSHNVNMSWHQGKWQHKSWGMQYQCCKTALLTVWQKLKLVPDTSLPLSAAPCSSLPPRPRTPCLGSWPLRPMLWASSSPHPFQANASPCSPWR